MSALSRDALYGYEMARHLADAGLDTVAEGSIYPALGRLERAGLIEGFTRSGSGGPPRKYYRLTASGRRTLATRSADWRSFATAVEQVLAGQDEGEAHG
jgi:PadR family transcriptional regulator PadR